MPRPLSYSGIAVFLLNLGLKVDSAWDDPALPPAEARVRRGDLAAGRELLAQTRTDPERRALRAGRLAEGAVRRVAELARLAEEQPDDPDLFGAAFYLAGDLDRARRHLSEVGRNSIPRTLPWLYLNRIPSSHYRVARLRAR